MRQSAAEEAATRNGDGGKGVGRALLVASSHADQARSQKKPTVAMNRFLKKFGAPGNRELVQR